MKKLGWLLVVPLLATPILFAPQQGWTAGGPPDNWRAYPPVHIHRNATSAPVGYSPPQIRHAYGFDQLKSDGTGQIIAIVDAYDDPTAASDLQTFITRFGLQQMYGLPNTPKCTVGGGNLHPCFQKVYAQSKPRTDSGWALEISLDVQWAHAIAPGADILLVEAKNNSLSSLLGAVSVAANSGAKAVSMSWGGSEFLFETFYDGYFNVNGVTFTASSGDNGSGVIWPAASPYVVAVGGTTLPLDSNGNFACPPPTSPPCETAWSGSGGGVSALESEPGYQQSWFTTEGFNTNGSRGVPDVAYDADPATGVAVYDSTPYNGQSGWWQLGGTSVGAPQWAALIVLADQGRSASLSSNNLNSSPLYNAGPPSTVGLYASNYRDITSGSNGAFNAGYGYDFVTGLGTPLANNLVPYLSSH